MSDDVETVNRLEYLLEKLCQPREREKIDRIKIALKQSTPKSSILYKLATNYKEYYLKFSHRHNFFIRSRFGPFTHSGKFQKRVHKVEHSFDVVSIQSTTANCNFTNDQHNVSEKKALDIW